ncbi:MAG: type II secretion system F family protein [Planctomycetota bacterium]|nr:type II secretion system F family protein [Planctomycetota bacterium]
MFALNFEYIVPIAVFGAIAAVAWFVLEQFAGQKPRAEERLAELRDPRRRRKAGETGSARETMASALEKAAPTLSKPLQSKNEHEIGKLKQKLSAAGFRSEPAVNMFYSLKVICLMIGVALGGGIMVWMGNFEMQTLLRAGMSTFSWFYVPDVILWFLAKQRKDNIFFGLPDALDLMVVCVEAGLGLDQAMRKVADEMKKSYRVISDEFALCNFQIQMGRPRREVLQDLGYRTGVDDLRSLASVLIQAEKFGSSVGRALRVQSDSMRTRRRQLAEEKAAKTAVQLIFPLVLFIFPGIFVVLVGPAAIKMVNEMFPAMGGH